MEQKLAGAKRAFDSRQLYLQERKAEILDELSRVVYEGGTCDEVPALEWWL